MPRYVLSASVCLCAFVVSSAFAAENEWAQWRGPNRDGVSKETGLLKSWPVGGPKLAWRAEGLGSGFSSVSVAGGKIYTMGDKDGSCQIIALNEKDGKQIWMAKVGAMGEGGGYPGPRGTPTVDGDKVYALGQVGDLICVNAADGKEVWRKRLDRDFGGKMMSGWGYAESPLVDGDRLLCTPGGASGTVLALNKKTGEKMWQTAEWTDLAAYSSLVPVEIGGVKQYLQLTGNSVAGITPEGKLTFKAPRNGKTAVVPTPIFYQNSIFVTSGYGVGCNAFNVTFANNKFSATEAYQNTALQNHHGGCVQINGYIYGHSDKGGWTCMEMKTGKVMWANPGVGKGSCVYADGCLYTRSEGGGRRSGGAASGVAIVAAVPQGYQELGRFDQPDRSGKSSWAHPVVCNGKFYLRDQELLLCYDVKGK